MGSVQLRTEAVKPSFTAVRRFVLENQENYSYRCKLGADLLELSRKAKFRTQKMEKKPRGEISGFTDKSRSRLMKLMACVDRNAVGLPVFVTLTYPAEWPGDAEEWKRHLDQFRREISEKLPNMAAVWRIEPQQRGAPHYHLLVWGGRIEKEWLAKAWYRIVGSEDPRHLKAGTRVESLRSWGGVNSYVSKYVAKSNKGGEAQEFDKPIGRYWGVWNKPRLLESVAQVQVSVAGYIRIRRIVRKWYARKTGHQQRRPADRYDMPGIWAKIPREQGEKLLRAFNVEEERLLF